MTQYPSGDDEFDWITGMCFAGAMAILVGLVLLLVWCSKQEMKSRQDMRPQTIAEKWQEHNAKKL